MNAGNCSWHIVANLQNVQFLITVDADWPIKLLLCWGACRAVNIVWRIFIVGTFHKLHVFDADFFACPANEWQILINRCRIEFRVEVLLTVPGTWVVVPGILDRGGAENVAQVVPFRIWIEVIGFNQVAQIGTTHRVIASKIEIGDIEAVRRHHIGIVRNSDGCPMMTANTFKVPNLIFVSKCDPVAFVCAILFKQTAQALNPVPRAMNVW